MKYVLVLFVLIAVAGCASKKLRKNCDFVSHTGPDQFFACEDL